MMLHDIFSNHGYIILSDQKLMREKHTRFSPRFYPQIAIYNQLYLCSYSYHSLPAGIITKCVLSSVEYNYNIFG